MTAPKTTETAPVSAVPPPEPEPRFGDLFAAEWIKLWSLRSTPWALAATAVLLLAITVTGALGDVQNYRQATGTERAYFRMFGAPAEAFSTGAATLLTIGAGAVGAIAVLGEYTSGMIRTTFTAVPARGAVMAAKVAVVALVTTGLGAVLALASFGAAQAVLSGEHAAVGLGHEGVLRLLAASALLAPVSALVGMGLATLIRHSALTIVATIALLFVLPSLLNSRKHLSVSLLHLTVVQAWGRIGHEQSTTEQWPWTVGGACVVLGAWALVAAAATVLVPNHRDQ
ncbi:ABC transporter permease [Kitasatospora sp. NPDC056651]|uniref:ABC transporter permease n=1 Tax=Kitasatospora sp. NPDC056651 TaxID=3345892 RepID=UPI0036A6C9C3